jgi:hypothetical protein
MSQRKATVTLPDGVSLDRVGQVLLDAWEGGMRQRRGGLPELREGGSAAVPIPRDAPELFRLLSERQVPYLLVGGIAMLTYVEGRNTKDVDLLISIGAARQIPELEIEDVNDFFARARFRSVRVDLLLTGNPLFKVVAETYATQRRFAELDVPAVTVEGLIVLKLYALPSLYRQMDMDRVALYENDITMLLARHSPKAEPLLALVEKHVETGDIKELRKIFTECTERARRLRERAGA